MSFAVPSNAILIQTLADLPQAVGGVITLPAGRVIIIDKGGGDPLQLPDDTQLVVPTTSVLRGWDADQNGIIGNVDAPMIVGEGDGLVITDCFLRNFSTDANAFCAEVENGFPGAINGRASRIDRVSVGGSGGLHIKDATAVQCLILSRATREGIRLSGATAGIQILECVFQPDVTDSPSHLVLDGGSHTALRVTDAAFVLTDDSTGIEMLNEPTLALFRLGDSDFIPQPAGGTPGVPFSGNIASGSGPVPFGPDSQSDVLFLSNFGVTESSFSGAMVISSNPTDALTGTLAAGVGNFVRVGAGDPNHPIFVAQSPTARFLVVDQVDPNNPQAQRQVLVYAGPEPITVDVQATSSVKNGAQAPTPDIFQLEAAIRIVYVPISTGVPQPQPATTTALADGFSGQGAVGELTTTAPRLTLQPGDALYVEFANLTNSPPGNPLVDLIVDNISLSFG